MRSITDVNTRYKTQLDSLRTRLAVASKEKNENEAKVMNLTEELDRKVVTMKAHFKHQKIEGCFNLFFVFCRASRFLTCKRRCGRCSRLCQRWSGLRNSSSQLWPTTARSPSTLRKPSSHRWTRNCRNSQSLSRCVTGVTVVVAKMRY